MPSTSNSEISLLVSRKIFAQMVSTLDTDKVQKLGVTLNGDENGATFVGSVEALEALGLSTLLAEISRIAEENKSRSFGG